MQKRTRAVVSLAVPLVAFFVLAIAGWIIGYESWMMGDPRVQHRLYGVACALHLLALVALWRGAFAALSRIRQAKGRETRWGKIGKTALAVTVCLALLGTTVVLPVSDMFLRDWRDFSEYRVMEVQNREQKLVAQEWCRLLDGGVCFYTEQDGKPGDYLGTFCTSMDVLLQDDGYEVVWVDGRGLVVRYRYRTDGSWQEQSLDK